MVWPIVTLVSSELHIIPYSPSQCYMAWCLPLVDLITILLKWASSAPPPPSVIKPHPASLTNLHTRSMPHTTHTYPISGQTAECQSLVSTDIHIAMTDLNPQNLPERLNFNLFSSEPVSFDYTTPALRLHSLWGTGAGFCYWLTFNWLQSFLCVWGAAWQLP